MRPDRHFEVYFDFDNTITDFDVLDEIIRRFSVDEEWKVAEAAWERGEIGSKECLERQFSRVRVSEKVLDDYVRSIRIDPAFGPIVELLGRAGIKPVILSDSFRSIINVILENNQVPGIQVFANEMTIRESEPVLGFPYHQSICSTAGNCKTSHLFKRDRLPGTIKVYIGDGRSDICPARFCELLFAKGTLFEHYSPIRDDCIRFEDLSTVHAHLKGLLS